VHGRADGVADVLLDHRVARPLGDLLHGEATVTLPDGWGVVTADGSLSAHFEHTIAVTDDGPEVFTLPA
jgi:hypothetical protein